MKYTIDGSVGTVAKSTRDSITMVETSIIHMEGCMHGVLLKTNSAGKLNGLWFGRSSASFYIGILDPIYH